MHKIRLADTGGSGVLLPTSSPVASLFPSFYRGRVVNRDLHRDQEESQEWRRLWEKNKTFLLLLHPSHSSPATLLTSLEVMGGCSSRFHERGTHTASVKRRDGGLIGEAWNKNEAAAAAAAAAAATAAVAVPAPAAAPEILTVSSSTTSSPTTRTQCPCCPRPTAAITPNPFAVEVVSPQRRESGRASEVLVRRTRHPPTGFPVEILRSCIFGFLGAGCLQRASGACRAWRDAAVDEQLWKELCLRRWVGKHVAFLEDCHHFYQQQRQQAEDGDEGETSEE
ncbi:unnamed protein product, partial [Ectocarpus sp. 12 AP-2014]